MSANNHTTRRYSIPRYRILYMNLLIAASLGIYVGFVLMAEVFKPQVSIETWNDFADRLSLVWLFVSALGLNEAVNALITELMNPIDESTPEAIKVIHEFSSAVNLRHWVGIRRHVEVGYVYIIQDIDISKLFKIGMTNKPFDRMYTFGVKLPFETELIHVIPSRNAYHLEQTLHARFAAKRVNGEWFDLSAEDVAYIKGIAE